MALEKKSLKWGEPTYKLVGNICHENKCTSSNLREFSCTALLAGRLLTLLVAALLVSLRRPAHPTHRVDEHAMCVFVVVSRSSDGRFLPLS